MHYAGPDTAIECLPQRAGKPPAEVMPASVFAQFCTHSQAFIHETDDNLGLQRYTAELQDRAPLQAQSSGWIASPATRDRLSWHWIMWRLLPLKPTLNDYSRWVKCVVI